MRGPYEHINVEVFFRPTLDDSELLLSGVITS